MKTRLNPDTVFVKSIKKRIKANNGYCPSAIFKTADQKCPCIDFRDKNTPGYCGCGLFELYEDGEYNEE